jgi:hypothetical protein
MAKCKGALCDRPANRWLPMSGWVTIVVVVVGSLLGSSILDAAPAAADESRIWSMSLYGRGITSPIRKGRWIADHDESLYPPVELSASECAPATKIRSPSLDSKLKGRASRYRPLLIALASWMRFQ